jgi:aminopeptidase N
MNNLSITLPKYLKDYQEPNYFIDKVELTFVVNYATQQVVVTNQAYYSKNNATSNNSLTLDGEAQLNSIMINDNNLNSNQYQLNKDSLLLDNLPNQFSLTINTTIFPWQNKTCMGLYESRNNLLTQCEAEGFRKITYYQDRPDVMSIFTVNIVSSDDKYNAILSNGNLISDVSENGTRKVTWHDPFKKPSYLFALVIANLASISGNYKTRSGKDVLLEIYAEPKHLEYLGYALESVKRAMQWDEERFNLEYDLERYMIVATSDFNMGAMENKGLNIFNTKYVLASPTTATDNDLIKIEAVIGHEYFHNWTGNRVTCKNWFQLSLKEGLTVFRDQEFTADLHGRGVKRIDDVKALRKMQFPEDAGPLAHSVRPASYVVMDNFYSMTVYEKGAEVVRMYQTILGRDGFNRGMSRYFERHDGQAVTCDDFCHAMFDDNNQIDLQQFMLWYSQAGTPEVKVSDNYNSSTCEYTLHFTQHIPDTPNQINKKPHLIPVKIGLLDSNGHDLLNVTITQGLYIKRDNELVLLLNDYSNSFTFAGVKVKPTPSLLREFSAPVKLEYNYNEAQRLLIINNDSDEFNRFEHLQQFFSTQIKTTYNNMLQGVTPTLDKQLVGALSNLLNNPNLDCNYRALLLSVPNFSEMYSEFSNLDPALLAKAITHAEQQIGELLFDSLVENYNLNLDKTYTFSNSGRRRLKNAALYFIIRTLNHKLDNPNSLQLIETMALGQFRNADNMTDTLAVMLAVNDTNNEIRDIIFNEFYHKWQDNELVMDKWFALQAVSNYVTIEKLNRLLVDKTFIATNPNKIYALLVSFTSNGAVFNSEAGYSFVADQIIAIDKFNPSVASRLVKGFSQVGKMNSNYKNMAKAALQRITNNATCSSNVLEIAGKILQVL